MEGHLKQRGKKRVWYLVYDEPRASGKRKQRWISLKTTSKRDAEKAKREFLTQLENPRSREAELAELTVSELLSKWLECRESTLATNTHERYGSLTRCHVVPVIGQIRLGDVRPCDIDSVYTAMRKRNLSERTCLHVHRALHAAFAFAVRYMRAVPENVVARVQAPRPKTRENGAFSIPQIQVVLEAARASRLEVLVLAAALTGLRRGELLALKWSGIDFDGKYLHVTEALEQTAHFGVRFKEPKSRSSRRRLPLSDALATILMIHRENQKEELARYGGSDQGLVFCNQYGGVWPPDSLTKQFAEMCRSVGILGFRLHDLRHAFTSVGLSNGSNVKEVSTLLGHSSPMLTLTTYARAIEGQGREAVNGIARSLLGDPKEIPSLVSNG